MTIYRVFYQDKNTGNWEKTLTTSIFDYAVDCLKDFESDGFSVRIEVIYGN